MTLGKLFSGVKSISFTFDFGEEDEERVITPSLGVSTDRGFILLGLSPLNTRPSESPLRLEEVSAPDSESEDWAEAEACSLREALEVCGIIASTAYLRWNEKGIEVVTSTGVNTAKFTIPAVTSGRAAFAVPIQPLMSALINDDKVLFVAVDEALYIKVADKFYVVDFSIEYEEFCEEGQ